MTHVHYVTFGDAKLASYNLRIKKVREAFEEFDYRIKVTEGTLIDARADINVFGKHFNPVGDLIQAQTLKTANPRSAIVFDICDNWFNDAKNAFYYHNMCLLADEIVVCSEHLRKAVKTFTGRESVVIKDMYTFPEGTPKEGGPLNVVWFGHESNLPALLPYRNLGKQLTVYSNTKMAWVKAVFNYKEWTENTHQEIKEYDILFLPTNSDPNMNPHPFSKSPNRMVDAIRSGLFVITDGVTVYGELSEYGCVCSDVEEGLDYAQLYWPECRERVKNGQKYIQEFSPVQISNQWRNVFHEVSYKKKHYPLEHN